MTTFTMQQRRDILDSANGKVFSCTFRKKDGSLREMTAKKWMEKSFSNGSANAGANTVAHKPEYYTCAEVSSGSFKNVNLMTLVKAKVNGKEYNFEEENV